MNINHEKAIYAVAGAVVGGAATYFATVKHIKRKFARLAEEEIDSVKDSFNLFHGKGPYKDPEAQIAEVRQRVGYFDQLNELAYKAQEDLEAENIEIKAASEERVSEGSVDVGYYDPDEPSNQVAETISEDLQELFVTNEPSETEVGDPSVPYYINEVLFMQTENTHDKIHVEWYDEDNTLADESDSLIAPEQVVNLLGPNFVSWFGKDEDYPNIIHVRNDRLRADFEVTLNEGSYTKLVLGFDSSEDDRFRHRKQVKKLRDDD